MNSNQRRPEVSLPKWKRVPGLYVKRELADLIVSDIGADWHFSRLHDSGTEETVFEVWVRDHDDEDAP